MEVSFEGTAFSSLNSSSPVYSSLNSSLSSEPRVYDSVSSDFFATMVFFPFIVTFALACSIVTVADSVGIEYFAMDVSAGFVLGFCYNRVQFKKQGI